jgi:hypothetical protein
LKRDALSAELRAPMALSSDSVPVLIFGTRFDYTFVWSARCGGQTISKRSNTVMMSSVTANPSRTLCLAK